MALLRHVHRPLHAVHGTILLKSKADQLDTFKVFEARMRTQHKHAVSCVEQLQTDNAGECLSRACKAYCLEKGIHHQTIVAYDSESNGLPERLNRSIMEIAESSRMRANPWHSL